MQLGHQQVLLTLLPSAAQWQKTLLIICFQVQVPVEGQVIV